MIWMDSASIGFKERIISTPRGECCQEECAWEDSWLRAARLKCQRQHVGGAFELQQPAPPATTRARARKPARVQLQLLQMTQANPMRHRAHARAAFLGFAPGADGNREREFNLARSHGNKSGTTTLTEVVNRLMRPFRQPQKWDDCRRDPVEATHGQRAHHAECTNPQPMQGMGAKDSPSRCRSAWGPFRPTPAPR